MVTVKVCETPKEIVDHLELRRIIFIIGQDVPEELEMDGLDEVATLYIAYDDEEPVGCGRTRLVDDYIKVERIGVLPNQRGKHIGVKIMEKIESDAKEFTKCELLKMNAQCHAEGFYKKLGYSTKGEIFQEAGIDHVRMVKAI